MTKIKIVKLLGSVSRGHRVASPYVCESLPLSQFLSVLGFFLPCINLVIFPLVQMLSSKVLRKECRKVDEKDANYDIILSFTFSRICIRTKDTILKVLLMYGDCNKVYLVVKKVMYGEYVKHEWKREPLLASV
jgi:hypothetical protein